MRPLSLAGPINVAGMAILVAAGPASAESDLLKSLTGGDEGEVEVISWIETEGGSERLIITFQPTGDVRLVADPGITVAPVAAEGVTWHVQAPVRHVETGADYFLSPPTLSLAFDAAAGTPVGADIEYAYCFTDEICLFGEARVSHAAGAPRG